MRKAGYIEQGQYKKKKNASLHEDELYFHACGVLLLSKSVADILLDSNPGIPSTMEERLPSFETVLHSFPCTSPSAEHSSEHSNTSLAFPPLKIDKNFSNSNRNNNNNNDVTVSNMIKDRTSLMRNRSILYKNARDLERSFKKKQ